MLGCSSTSGALRNKIWGIDLSNWVSRVLVGFEVCWDEVRSFKVSVVSKENKKKDGGRLVSSSKL